MAYLYLDDSKHHKHGFSLATFVICEHDPTEAMAQIYRCHGYNPASFEFKASKKMQGDQALQKLREDLKQFIQTQCKVAVCIVDDDKRLGPAALRLLSAALSHPTLSGRKHEVTFDEGLFSSVKAAERLAAKDPCLRNCNFAFEQDSGRVLGIQIADLVAHTCATMLRESLLPEPKKITWDDPADTIYHGLEVPLEFEMWASIRYSFLCMNKPAQGDDFDFSVVNVFPWGLYVDEGVDDRIATAAFKHFGENYVGCCH